MQHSWRSKALTWQALGDHSFDLTHEVDGGDTDNAPGPSTSMDGDALEKGKGKAREVEPEKEKEREKLKDEQEKPHRKWPFSQMSKPVLKSAMKTPKRGKSGQERKSRELVDSLDKEEEEDGSSKPRSDTPSALWASPIPGLSEEGPLWPWNKLDCLPRVPKSNIQQTPPLMRPDIPESSQATSESPRDVAPVVDAGAILIPGPNNPCRCCTQYELLCTTSLHHSRTVYRVLEGLLDRPIDLPVNSADLKPILGAVGSSDHCIIEFGCSPCSPGPPDPRPPLDVDRESANRIAALEACASEQESTINTLRRLHESLRRQIMQQHPSFPLLDSPPTATSSLLLDQAAPGSQSHVHLAPLALINFSINSTGEEASTIVAPVMEPTIPPSQTEAALDTAPAIASTVPVNAVHSPADDGASTFALAFALLGPPEMYPSPLETPADSLLEMHPSPLETPEDGPGAAEIVECGSPLNLLSEYDSGDEQDATMQM
ncbi:uncharacterized protein EDB91DRAFT_1084190 [Suillus paluster]|uniref:uncharacterized protein n=1 Tax=Suillus paluster TaxID=48578 RepID=UPI001B87DC60|nr:uncharacterized protein EDB91DRAFT_1084190 [Suillus paluster]KAG1734044.1 hypothetical protein EDB91DRAFT_1084190 [Suillus paluster]